jgi:hypothetical protein
MGHAFNEMSIHSLTKMTDDEGLQKSKDELTKLIEGKIRQIRDRLTTTQKLNKLTNLQMEILKLFAFSIERKESAGMTPEVVALHVSSLYQDEVSFKADHEKTIVAFVLGGTEALNALTLNGREVVNLMCRSVFASVILSKILQRRIDKIVIHDKIIDAAKERSLEPSKVQSALRKLSEDYSAPLFVDFDESSLEGDRDTVLRALLIDGWNKCDENAFSQWRSECFENLARLTGISECPPQLGQDQIARD